MKFLKTSPKEICFILPLISQDRDLSDEEIKSISAAGRPPTVACTEDFMGMPRFMLPSRRAMQKNNITMVNTREEKDELIREKGYRPYF